MFCVHCFSRFSLFLRWSRVLVFPELCSPPSASPHKVHVPALNSRVDSVSSYNSNTMSQEEPSNCAIEDMTSLSSDPTASNFSEPAVVDDSTSEPDVSKVSNDEVTEEMEQNDVQVDCEIEDEQEAVQTHSTPIMSAVDQVSYSYQPSSSSLPTSLIRTITLGDEEVETTLILQLFSDRIFISITQLSGKVGSLLTCNVEESIVDNSTTYNVRTLLGTGVASRGGGGGEREVSIREVFVRRLAERIVRHTRKMAGVSETTILGGAEDGVGPIAPLLVGVGLKPGCSDLSIDSFNVLVDAAMELYLDGWKISNAGSMVGMEGPD